jgi:hypothetical protein
MQQGDWHPTSALPRSCAVSTACQAMRSTVWDRALQEEQITASRCRPRRERGATPVLTQMLPPRSSGTAICTTPLLALPGAYDLTPRHGRKQGRSEEERLKKTFLHWSGLTLKWPHHSGSGCQGSSFQPSRQCVSRQAVPGGTATRVRQGEQAVHCYTRQRHCQHVRSLPHA